jgi:hypothetical protein
LEWQAVCGVRERGCEEGQEKEEEGGGVVAGFTFV